MPHPKLLLVSIFLITLTSRAYAQTTNEFTGPYPNESAVKEQAAAKSAKKIRHGIFSPHRVNSFHYKKRNVKHSAEYEFYKRVEEAAKEKQRLLKKFSKPQYSDFLYYGHKRKPKIHRPEKMRYCKECGI